MAPHIEHEFPFYIENTNTQLIENGLEDILFVEMIESVESDEDGWDDEPSSLSTISPVPEEANLLEMATNQFPLGPQTIEFVGANGYNPLASSKNFKAGVSSKLFKGGYFLALNFWFDLDCVISRDTELSNLKFVPVKQIDMEKQLSYLDLAYDFTLDSEWLDMAWSQAFDAMADCPNAH